MEANYVEEKNKIIIIIFSIAILIISFILLILFNNHSKFNLNEINKKQYVSDLVKKIRYSKNYGNYRGKSIKIAIIDSGVYANHNDFSINIKKGYNFIDNDEIMDDSNGHGTQITGIIGSADNNKGVVGIAPMADIYPLKILDNNGRSKVDKVIEALDWCIKNNINIINLSFSINVNNSNLYEKINQVTELGIIVVASYSNLKNTYDYPAMYDNVIGVKGTNKEKVYVDNDIFYAYGEKIVTTNNDGEYIRVSGNSFASAQVTGVVALIIERYRGEGKPLSISNIKDEFEKIFN